MTDVDKREEQPREEHPAEESVAPPKKRKTLTAGERFEVWNWLRDNRSKILALTTWQDVAAKVGACLGLEVTVSAVREADKHMGLGLCEADAGLSGKDQWARNAIGILAAALLAVENGVRLSGPDIVRIASLAEEGQ